MVLWLLVAQNWTTHSHSHTPLPLTSLSPPSLGFLAISVQPVRTTLKTLSNFTDRGCDRCFWTSCKLRSRIVVMVGREKPEKTIMSDLSIVHTLVISKFLEDFKLLVSFRTSSRNSEKKNEVNWTSGS
ncbi:hypothetical protein C1H46_000076 [Malus baccata]|uniref:Uncharacterized protein n=1 Tax=Malus baccata TaxID=106549 RepID=A0A540NT24_MALBA|nr:hypothetical protein C1H46_000076 [Malus baccata]